MTDNLQHRAGAGEEDASPAGNKKNCFLILGEISHNVVMNYITLFIFETMFIV